MNIEKNITEFAEFIKNAENLRPFVRMTIDTINSFSDEFKEIPEQLCSWIRSNRIAGIRQYIDAGFSREEAITMTLDDIFAIQRIMKSSSSSVKNK